MSFGALSANAIRALNGGARQGGFAHDTGEGGVSRYHREMGGDLIWEIGSGYFGCRRQDGTFCPDRFAKVAAEDQIKMIEVKLSQGAKPGHGGVLPAPKVSAEIAAARGVPMGQDCISPPRHSAFSTPVEFVRFLAELRRLSGGKPVGFKLCVGHRWEFLAICKAMLDTDIYPDFIVVDGKEGGTGAAPLEFLDHLGMPLREGLSFVHNALVGAGMRDRIKIGASGKIVSGFDIARAMALGVVLVLTAVFVAQRIGKSPRVPGDSRDASRIPAIAGYQVNGGPHGRAMEAGGPWGFACAPVLFRLDASTPPAVVAQFSGVVSAASEQGLNMAAVIDGAEPPSGTLAGDPSSWIVVPVAYSLAAAPANEEGRPMTLGGEYGGRLTPDGRWEDYTSWTLVLYGRTMADDPLLQRKAARVAVARVTGLAGSLSPSSGITRGMRSEVDAFTPADLAAMHAMAGCPVPPTR